MSDSKERKAWDRFAAAALQGLLAGPESQRPEDAATAAAAAADQLLKERRSRFDGDRVLSHQVD